MKKYVLSFIRKIFLYPLPERILVSLVQFAKKGALHEVLLKFAPNPTDYPVDFSKTVKRNNIFFHLQPSDYMEWHVYWSKHDLIKEVFSRYAKDKNSFYDIGANIGWVSLFYSKALNSKSKVYSFEPDLQNFKRLETNVKLNDSKNITLFNYGISNLDNEQATLYDFKEGNHGMKRILKDKMKDSKSCEIINYKLDSIVFKTKEAVPPEFIKIDVEGYEYKVLQGAEQTLIKYLPGLLIEVDINNLKSNDTSNKEIVDFLKKIGYNKIIDIIDGKPYDVNSAREHTDILCLA